MKKLVFCVMAILLSLTFMPIRLNAATAAGSYSPVASKPGGPSDSSDVKALKLRLDEIKTIDRSELKASERRELRKEKNSLKAEVRRSYGGIYISAGAVVLVIVLIIIL